MDATHALDALRSLSTDDLRRRLDEIDAATVGEPLPPAMLMTVDDLARELRTSAKTIRCLDAAGRLPRAVRISRRKRWPRQTIVAWIPAGCPNRKEWESFYEPARGKRR